MTRIDLCNVWFLRIDCIVAASQTAYLGFWAAIAIATKSVHGTFADRRFNHQP